MEYMFNFIPQAQNEQLVNANMTQNILVTTQSCLKKKKKKKKKNQLKQFF